MARIIFLGIISLVFVAGCTTPPLKNDKLLSDDSLITGESCQAPCWQNIIPGVTSLDTAQSIIADLSFVERVQSEVVQRGQPAEYITFAALDGDQVCCEVYSDDGETVSRLLLRVAPQMTLGEIVDVYGDPTYVFASPYTNEEAVGTLIYPEFQMILAFQVSGGIDTGIISPESEVVGVFLATPESIEQVISVSNLYLWDGFQPYSTYEQETYDVVPVTVEPQ